MRMPGYKHARLSARWLRSRFVDRAVILGYHRIADVAWDPFGVCVSPQHFVEQVRFLHEQANPISLKRLAQGLRRKKLPKRAVVVTFDDGYLDTLVHAKSLLEQYRIPATVFVTTGYLGREFWWDELVRLLIAAGETTAPLHITLGDRSYTWEVAEKNGLPTGEMDFAPKRELIGPLSRLLLPLDTPAREQVLCQMRLWSGAPSAAPPAGRSMTPDELVELAASDLIEIGAHTVTHPLLAALPPAAQQAEMQRSRAYLETLLDCPVNGFSYPNGSADAATIAHTRAAGFAYACASHTDVAWRGSNRFCLPRLWAPDRPGAAFAAWLNRWL